MLPSPRLFFIIPVLNESPNIPRLMSNLEELRASLDGQFDCRIFFVDDGSTDDTAARILKSRGSLSVEVLTHQSNRGPGAAFGTGFTQLHSLLGETDWVVTLEGDNTSRIQTLR